jgi:hypothetical protein
MAGLLDFFNTAGGYDPNTMNATNTQGGMNLPNLFMTQPGLANAFMTPEQQQALQSQATKRGLLTGALTYLATPKNLGLGSAVPYLSKAYLGGMQGAQGTYDVASKNLTDMMTLQKLGRQIELQGMTGGEKAQNYLNKAQEALSKDPNNPALKAAVINAQNQLKKETTFAPPNIIFQQESAEKGVVGKGMGEDYLDVIRAPKATRDRVAKLERADELLKGIETGKYTAYGLEVSKGLNSLGFPVGEDVGNLEAADALLKEYALSLRNPAGGAGMPGAMSDADREFLVKAAGSITNTPEGRKLMLETQRALLKRDEEVAKLAMDYRKNSPTKSIDEGFYEVLREYANKNPLFGKLAEAQTSMQQNMVGGDIQPKTSGGFRIID